MNMLLACFKPAAHIARLPYDKTDPTYKRLRLQVFIGIFLGYAGYYLVRKNFSLAMPYLIEQGYTQGNVGLALSGLSIAYGISKFLMGNISDRSNPRYFLATGLLLSAALNVLMGYMPYLLSSVWIMFILLFLNGWFQGMGWPPCGRTMVHWYSQRERGTWVSVWNVAHNVGGGLIGPLASLGLAIFGAWQSLFYFPAAIAVVIALIAFFAMRDTPQSCGLPPIEEHRNDYPLDNTHLQHAKDPEQELSGKDIFFKYVFCNRYLWYIAVANVFIYLVRYGVVDWVPTYLTLHKGFSHDQANWAYFLFEYAGIPGTILCGLASDKLFSGRRAPIGIIYMLLVSLAVVVYWLNPFNSIWVYNACLVAIGFLIYGPVMLIGLFALDLVPKKAAGTAAGLTGLFGYFFGSVLGDAGIGYAVDWFGWRGGFIVLVASCILSIVFLSLTWNIGKAEKMSARRV